MLENCKSAQERWGGVSDIIDRWLQERKQLLVQYCNLSELAEDGYEENSGPAVQKLCQILVDYISVGHFEVYDQLVKEGLEFDDQEALDSAKEPLRLIDDTTEHILDFNDKYQETDDLGAFLKDLSDLGEVLAQRFEAEDSMIEVLHMAHKDQVA